MTDRLRSPSTNELTHLARTFRSHGRVVTVRCVAIPSRSGQRFEITLWGNGTSAIVDVPGWAEADLPDWIDTATDAFVAALALRD